MGECLNTDDRALMKDVDVVEATCNQCAWIEPGPLRKVEKETGTLIFLDHGPAVAECDWDGTTPAAAHICALHEGHRNDASKKVHMLLANVTVPREDDELSENGEENARG